MDYDELLIESESLGLLVKEKSLKYNDGRIKGNKIAIRKNLGTSTEKACVLAEELGHYHTAVGTFIDQSDVQGRKLELYGRLWAYNHQIGLSGIINAYKHGCYSLIDAAEYLNVTEDFLLDALECYRSKYGICVKMDNYVIYFEPSLGVFELK